VSKKPTAEEKKAAKELNKEAREEAGKSLTMDQIISQAARVAEKASGLQPVFSKREGVGKKATSFGSLVLDYKTGGGVPPGRVIGIAGPEGAGKSLLSTDALACQLAALRPGVYYDAEGATDQVWLKARGIDLEKYRGLRNKAGAMMPGERDLVFFYQPLTGEEMLQHMVSIMDAMPACAPDITAPPVIFVTDSVVALISDALSDNLDANKMAMHAKMYAEMLPVLSGRLSRTGCSWIYINQLRSKPGQSYGSPLYEPCLTGCTRIATDHGLIAIEDCMGKDYKALTPTGEVSVESQFIYTGKQKTVVVRFHNGMSLTVTPNHLLTVVDGDNKGWRTTDIEASKCLDKDVLLTSGDCFGADLDDTEVAETLAMGFDQTVPIPERIFRSTEKAMAAYLAQVLSTHAEIDVDTRDGPGIWIPATSLRTANDLQLLLLNFGVRTYLNSACAGSEVHDGKPMTIDVVEDCYDALRERIGFGRNPWLTEEAKKLKTPAPVGLKSDWPTVRVVSIEDGPEEDVFDVKEPITNHIQAGGIITHNCGDALKFFCSMRLNLDRSKPKIGDDEHPFVNESFCKFTGAKPKAGGVWEEPHRRGSPGLDRYTYTSFSTVKNKVYNPFKRGWIRIQFEENGDTGHGLDRVFDIFTFLLETGYLKKATAPKVPGQAYAHLFDVIPNAAFDPVAVLGLPPKFDYWEFKEHISAHPEFTGIIRDALIANGAVYEEDKG